MTTTKERAAMQQALEALDVLLTEPMAKIAADKAEALLLRAAPALREALANTRSSIRSTSEYSEQAEQEPVAEWEKLKDPQTLFVNLNRGFPAQLTHGHLLHLLNKTEQAEQEPVIRATLAPPAPPEVYQMRSKEAYEAGWWEAQRQKAVSPIAPAQQAEQEPVGYFAYDEEHDIWEELTGPNAPGATKLYAAPVRTKDLTDEEIMDLVRDECVDMRWPSTPLFIARAVIAADREKNR